MLSTKKQKLISITSGLLAASLFLVIAWRLSSQVQTEMNKAVRRFGSETVWVLAATEDIKPGVLIDEENTELKLWASVLLREDTIDQDHVTKAWGRRAGSLILAGEPLSQTRLIEEQHKLDKLPAGFSAVTIEMNSVRALGGEIEPGMRVTVLDTQEANKAELLAPDVAVISTSTQKNQDKSKPVLGGDAGMDIAWVTLSVPDGLVARLVSAASSNNTYLVMPDDLGAFSRTFRSDTEKNESDTQEAKDFEEAAEANLENDVSEAGI